MFVAMRHAAMAAMAGGISLLALNAGIAPAEGQNDIIQDGKVGYVVSDISFVLSAPDQAAACPNGLNVAARGFGGGQGGQGGPRQQQAAPTPAQGGQEQTAPAPAPGQQQAQAQLGQAGQAAPTPEQVAAFQRQANTARSLCLNPETVAADPNFRVVAGPNVAVTGGIDLDGQDSRAGGRAAAGTCAHADFRTAAGARGIDNQFYRAVGCISAYQSGGPANGFTVGMLAGEWGILIELTGVNDLRNDNDVGVNIFANADPIQLSPGREPLSNATYAADQDPRFRATTRGRIVNGVLTTDAVDVRFHSVTNSMYLERPLRDARLRMTVGSDGALEGIMAGYTPVEDMYNLHFGFRNATMSNGQLAPERLRGGSAGGRAGTLGYSCSGIYHALLANADGHRDASSGRCTSISTQYHIRTVPAFVVDTPTRSVNDDLDRNRVADPNGSYSQPLQ